MVPGLRRRGEQGETLVEVLVAISILGIAGVAIFAGFALSVRASDLNRKQATSGSQVRSLAEAIQNYVAAGNYKPCAAPDVYVGAISGVVGSGYVATQTQAKRWTGAGWNACTVANDPGLQQIILKVASKDGDARRVGAESLVVVLRKPCNGTPPAACA